MNKIIVTMNVHIVYTDTYIHIHKKEPNSVVIKFDDMMMCNGWMLLKMKKKLLKIFDPTRLIAEVLEIMNLLSL